MKLINRLSICMVRSIGGYSIHKVTCIAFVEGELMFLKMFIIRVQPESIKSRSEPRTFFL
jgi:hypothetical protein